MVRCDSSQSATVSWLIILTRLLEAIYPLVLEFLPFAEGTAELKELALTFDLEPVYPSACQMLIEYLIVLQTMASDSLKLDPRPLA